MIPSQGVGKLFSYLLLLPQPQQLHLSEGLGLPGSFRELSGPRVLDQLNDLIRSSLLSDAIYTLNQNPALLNPTLDAPSVEPIQEYDERVH